MTYNEIIQKVGKRIIPSIYYEQDGETITINRDDINRAKLFFNASLTGTIMKGIEVELKVELPKDIAIYYQIIAKYGTNSQTKVYGPYYLKDVTYNADTKTYTNNLYDAFLPSMIDYTTINVTYPISVYNYFLALVSHLGYTTNITSLPNGSNMLSNDIYSGINFTFRDVFDDIGGATASLFYIDGNEVKKASLGTTEITIDDDILKNKNISFGEHFGAINTIVLSRSAESDNIYYPTILPENPVEYKIVDNQLMNGNNRVDYIEAIYNELNGVEYDIYDTELTGWGGFEPLSKIKFETGDNTYYSYVFNNEIEITQGYRENIFTELPEESVTNYKVADTTDKRINQAYIIVDKQNQRIDELVESTVVVSNTVTGVGSIILENAYKGQLYNLSIKGQISLLYPASDTNLYGYPLIVGDNFNISDDTYISSNIPYGYEILYPSNNLFGKNTNLLVDDTIYKLDFDFLNYISDDVCDEWIYDNGKQYIIRRVGIDEQGNKYPLATAIREDKEDISIIVDSDSTITLTSFPTAKLTSNYLLQNQYTDTFATEVYVNSQIAVSTGEILSKVEMKSEAEEKYSQIDQTFEAIETTVSHKVGDEEVISKINQTPEQISIDANKISLNGKTINMTSDNIKINSTNFNVDKDGNLNCNNATIDGTLTKQTSIGKIEVGVGTSGLIKITGTSGSNNYEGVYNVAGLHYDKNGNRLFSLSASSYSDGAQFQLNDINGNKRAIINSYRIEGFNQNNSLAYDISNDGVLLYSGNGSPICGMYDNGDIYGSEMYAYHFNQRSNEELKENIELYENALQEVLKTDIYKYNYKSDKTRTKKSIGFVIGSKRNYSKDITSVDKDGNEIGADLYSMVSVLWQAVKEQQVQIEELTEEIRRINGKN